MAYQIARSLRLNDDDSAMLTRTPGAASNRKTWTTSLWFKRGNIKGLCGLFIASSGVNTVEAGLYIDGSERLTVEINGAISALQLNAISRDPTAWTHVVVAFDTTQATASDRIKISVNGVLQTSFALTSYPAQNSDHAINDALQHRIGNFASSDYYFDGYIADFYLIDGQALAATDFGETDPTTGGWKPKAYVGTFGTNGFHLDFADNSGATATTIGKDTSGNSNNYTPFNISVTAGAGNDSLTDTPTNYGSDTGAGGEVRGNHATFNSVNKNSNATLSNGNLDIVTATANLQETPLTIPVQFGGSNKWFVEMTVNSVASTYYPSIGISPVSKNFIAANVQCGDSLGGTAYMATGEKYTGTVLSAFGAAFVAGDKVGLLIDELAGTVTAYKLVTGSWVSQGTLASGLTGTQVVTVTPYQAASASLNCGQRPFAAVAPSAGKALCTQNLPDPTIKKPSNGLSVVADTGANIAATLAAAHSGWSSYVDIFKRTDGVEGWRWRFSDDAGQYLDSSSTAAKAAFPALSGNYVGYAIRCDAGYPARTGTVSHTNGIPTTITNNLGTSRRLIFLKREDSTSNWFLRHPDVTAGSLLYMNLTAAGPAADTTITNVTANAFDIGSGAPSGTYRYIEIAETPGFFMMTKASNNAAADGPFAWLNQRSAWLLQKGDNDSAWFLHDKVLSPYNAAANPVLLNSTAAAGSQPGTTDVLANGIKTRTNLDPNGGTNRYVAAFADLAFKYSAATEITVAAAFDMCSTGMCCLP